MNEKQNVKDNPEIVYKTKQNQFGLGRKAFTFFGVMIMTLTVLVGLSLLGLVLLK